jgi:hypothetical protein
MIHDDGISGCYNAVEVFADVEARQNSTIIIEGELIKYSNL